MKRGQGQGQGQGQGWLQRLDVKHRRGAPPQTLMQTMQVQRTQAR